MTIKEWTTFSNYCFASQPSSVLLPISEDTTSKLGHIFQHSSVINNGDRFHICDKQYVHVIEWVQVAHKVLSGV